MTQITVQQVFELAAQHHQAGRLREAEILYRQVIALSPEFAESYSNLGVVLAATGRLDEAVAAYRQAIALRPTSADGYSNLGLALLQLRRFDEAVEISQRAVALGPTIAEAYNNLGAALGANGQIDQSIAAYLQANTLKRDFAEACYNLGDALAGIKRLEEAIAAYRRAIEIRPEYAEAWCNLGIALREQGRLDEAIETFERALKLRPAFAEAHNNLGVVQKATGQLDEAIASFRRVIDLKADYYQAHSNLIYSLYFHPDVEPKALAREHRQWAQVHAEPLKHLIRPHTNDRTPDRRLKIGYVSPDFRNHCQSFFTISLLSNHNHKAFEIYCYSSVSRPDAITERIRGYADHWIEATRLTDQELAEQIRQDRIDILVDLTMHMDGGRPLLFARKPAPVQVAWLAYPGSTGMSAIDYRLSDPYLDPPDEDETLHAERTVRLADSFWCYDPLSEEPATNPLPALSRGRFTFGCLNNFCKISEPVLELWAKVLTVVPGSNLLLLAPLGEARKRVTASLIAKGIDSPRAEYVAYQPRAEYLRTFGRIDLCLDTFSYNGHTTSLDSLWMGVPVVSLSDGKIPVARAGVSVLSNLGMKELLARDHREFVRIASTLAGDLPRLAAMRSGLRERMRRSPLMDGPRFAGNVEAAYRRMWRQWCDSGR